MDILTAGALCSADQVGSSIVYRYSTTSIHRKMHMHSWNPSYKRILFIPARNPVTLSQSQPTDQPANRPGNQSTLSYLLYSANPTYHSHPPIYVGIPVWPDYHQRVTELFILRLIGP
ncbi:unnamed protein product [Protopolystoma xenopodis]|uniref:Uncharacterized protein n=1 Tax=Protopolystoma xenopodis TaxID=117903 RepID=A0A448XID0_9PLAT|nr:unnamed protein product [Protopolystoma xenopodis]